MRQLFSMNNLQATEQFAELIAGVIVPDHTRKVAGNDVRQAFVVTLNGELGAGKTTLVRGVLLALLVPGIIKSPTFTLVEPYVVDGLNIYHFDLYRLNDPDEWFALGFDEYFGPDTVCFIEWAENAGMLIPQIDWQIDVHMPDGNEESDTDKRNICVTSKSVMGDQCLKLLIQRAANLFSLA